MRTRLIAILVAVAFGAAMTPFARDTTVTRSNLTDVVDIPADRELASLTSAKAWLNSPPLTAASLRGKVVLIDVWTYSCINWLRTLPHVRAWAVKYQDEGLVVIGVHAPEFAFEHDLDNVRQAARALEIDYPIAIDNDFAIWRAFRNNYWPALYLVDGQGRIRYRHFGEGNYAEAETMIQQLLAEDGSGSLGDELVSVEARGIEAAADWNSLRSPETYVGYQRAENLASPEGVGADARRIYTLPARLPLNRWALAGDWTIGKQATVLHQANGRVAFRFHARDLNLVMGPALRGTSIRYRVLIDGAAPGAAHGVDIDPEGYGTATEPRLYQLIRQSGSIADRLFTIEFLDPGVAAYVFTFG